MRKKSRRRSYILIYIAAVMLALAFFMPILVTFTNSFMSAFEITNRFAEELGLANSFHLPPGAPDIHFVEISLIPRWFTLRQYITIVFDTPNFLNNFWNSVKITAPVVAGQLLVSLPAAYFFEYCRLKNKEKLFFVYIVVMFMPLQVSLVPQYLVADFLNIKESTLAIVLPALFNPFGVFLLRQYFKTLPYEYIEAAKIDGAGHFGIMVSIVAPLLKPAVAALAILIFIEYWNVVEQALIFIKDSQKEPLSVYLSKLAKQNSDIIFAASCLYMMPALLVFLYGQEYLVEGIQLSGIK